MNQSKFTAMFSIGDRVCYTPKGEEGIVTSTNDTYVFVRYGAEVQGKATRPEDLRKES